MKKALSLILALVLCLSLCACSANNSELEGRIAALEKEIESIKIETNTTGNEQNLTGKQCPEEYVGEWKMQDGFSDNIYILQLNADGSGSLSVWETDVIWDYNEKYHTINVTFLKQNISGSFAIKEKDGKTVLDDTTVMFGRDFYRASDFDENNG